jgi:hypothetical protein
MLAEELEPPGIRVNGFIAGRCGTFDGFARAATYILSPAASYLTGNVITIDGGDRRGRHDQRRCHRDGNRRPQADEQGPGHRMNIAPNGSGITPPADS